MKAIVIRKFGDVSVLQEEEVQKPELSSDKVLVKIKASSVNPIDIKIRKLGLAIAPPLPAILHGDFSGVVESVGKKVKNFREGDEVFGRTGGVKGNEGGALSEYMIVEPTSIALKPKNLSFEESACLPCVALTSWIAIQERIKLQQNDKILIHGALGGVGHIAVQLAKFQKAQVFSTVSTDEKFKIAQDFHKIKNIINYKRVSISEYTKNFTKKQGFDYVFDTVGGENLDKSFEAVKKNGTVLSINTRSTHDLSPMHNKALTLTVIFTMLHLLEQEEKKKVSPILQEIKTLVEEEKLKVLLHEKIYSFSEIQQAHKCLEDGDAIGKIALKAWE